MPYAMAVRESLTALQCPTYSDSLWTGPFEQLAGAAYALLAAERQSLAALPGGRMLSWLAGSW